MKRLVLLLGLLLLLTGCDLRNRRASEDFIPTGNQAAAHTPAPAGTDAAPIGTAHTLPAQWDGAVKTVMTERGTFRGAEEIPYSYQIPFLDLPDAYAMGCNQEINARFEAAAHESLDRMEHGQPPIVQEVRFTADLRDTILSLRLHRLDADGTETWGFYCVDSKTGAKPTLSAFCQAAGVEEAELPQCLRDAATALTRDIAGDQYGEDDTEYTTALTLTLSGLAQPAELPMHLTEDGRLSVIVSVYHPGGGTTSEELILP